MRIKITSAAADPVECRSLRAGSAKGGRVESGQALVEMALIVPIVLILVLGIIEIGRYAYIAILVGNAARAGAAFGAQSKQQSNDSTGMQNAAQYDFAGSSSSTPNLGRPDPTNGFAYSTLTVTSATSCGCDR